MIQADTNEKKSVIDFLEKNPNIILCTKMIGKYNLLSIVALKSIKDLVQFKEQIIRHTSIRNVQEHIWVDVTMINHPENLVIETFDGLPHTTELTPKDENPRSTIPSPHVAELAEEYHLEASHELDKIDLQILRILSENACVSFRKMAKQLGISPQSVIRRYKRWKKTVAPYSSVTLDLKKIGYEGTAVFFVKCFCQYDISEVLDELLRVPNVIVAHRCLGPIDIVLAVPFTNVNNLFKLNDEIAKTPGVEQLELVVGELFPKWPLNVFTPLFSKQLQTTGKKSKSKSESHILQRF
jgi:DNA-binding Lrp family transcriptional regulator